MSVDVFPAMSPFAPDWAAGPGLLLSMDLVTSTCLWCLEPWA